jgi:hypothetical protein
VGHRHSDPIAFALKVSAVVVAVVGISVLTWALIHRTDALRDEPTGSALARSLESAVQSAAVVPAHCRQDGRTWRCGVSDSSGSGRGIYVITVDAKSCWTARRVEVYSVEEMARSAHGCL